MKKKICMILVAVFVAVLGTSTYFIIDHYKESNKQAELYGVLADLVSATAQVDAATEPAEQIPYSEEKMLLPELAEFYQQNGDLMGWISIADTNINYPVMQSVNEPNFYLKHGFDKEYSDYGCPYHHNGHGCNHGRETDHGNAGKDKLMLDCAEPAFPPASLFATDFPIRSGYNFLDRRGGDDRCVSGQRIPVQRFD